MDVGAVRISFDGDHSSLEHGMCGGAGDMPSLASGRYRGMSRSTELLPPAHDKGGVEHRILNTAAHHFGAIKEQYTDSPHSPGSRGLGGRACLEDDTFRGLDDRGLDEILLPDEEDFSLVDADKGTQGEQASKRLTEEIDQMIREARSSVSQTHPGPTSEDMRQALHDKIMTLIDQRFGEKEGRRCRIFPYAVFDLVQIAMTMV